jgi:hypothetical protein
LATALEPQHRGCHARHRESGGITGQTGKTVLRFLHGDRREATDFFAGCNDHWGYYLRSLKLHCETDSGTPFGEE